MSDTMREEQRLAEYLLNKPMCIFCSNWHKSENCNILVDTVARIECLIRKGLCLVCMSHHISFACPRTTYVCTSCHHMNHHVSLCYLRDKKDDEQTDSATK